MVANGSSGERYILNNKGKRKGGAYEDYPVSGTGGYCARIFARSRRSASVEAQIRDAVYSGEYIDGERPLNILYLHGKFAGYLYEQVAAPCGEIVENTKESAYSGGMLQTPGNEGTRQMAVIGIQLGVAAVMAFLGLKLAYPFFLDKIASIPSGSFAGALAALNYAGVPAVLAGIALQVFSFLRWREACSNPAIAAVAAAVSAMTGIAVWTCAVLVLVFLVEGVMNFLARYLVSIILIMLLFSWLKKNFRKFFR